MRQRVKGPIVEAVAIAGTHVIILAFDIPARKRKGLLGFAIHREDHTEDEAYWLRGFKTFEDQVHPIKPGELVLTLEHPIQGFWWGDYTAKPDHKYTYTVYPMYGKPKNLKQGDSTTITIETESEDQGKHAVFFNRGVAGSQAFARKFGKVTRPRDVADYDTPPFRWLSRGLEEAILDFIGSAKDGSYGIRAAFYEFNYDPVLQALAEADKRGADVKIIYDDRGKDKVREDGRTEFHQPGTASNEAIERVGLKKSLLVPRQTNSYIAHNKYMILLKDGKPIEVWTGSTNITAGGIYGQNNVGHRVRDPEVAAKYLEYWNALSEDPQARDLRKTNEQISPNIEGDLPNGTIRCIFSPRKDETALDWYVSQMEGATETAGFTAAFGVNKKIAEVLAEEKSFLRFILLEKENAPNSNTYDLFKDTHNNLIALGSVIRFGDIPEERDVHRFVTEGTVSGLNVHVRFLHTKYMLIDPLTLSPTVISGSANFSSASTKNNDENMLVIQGDTGVSDIYFGEFLRLFHHFYFRSFMQKLLRSRREVDEVRVSHLNPDDSWADRYYDDRSVKSKERALFMKTEIPGA